MANYTVQQSGGDYSTLAGAMSAASTNGDTISIQGTWTVDDTSTCTTAANISVSTDSSSKCAPYAVASPSHYRLRNTSGHSITVGHDLTITGVEIGSQSTGTSDEVFRVNAANITVTGDSCLLYFNSRNAEQDIFYTNTNGGLTLDLTNCIVWNARRAVWDSFDSTGDTGQVAKFNSCTFYNCGDGTYGERSGIVGAYLDGITVSAFNCLIHSGDGQYPFNGNNTGTKSLTVDRCMTNEAGFGSTTNPWDTYTETDSVSSVTFAETGATGDYVVWEDITTSPYDFRLVDDANNDAQDAHADGSGAGLTMPSTDIVGTSRPQNTNYDIGAFEIAAGGATNLVIADGAHGHTADNLALTQVHQLTVAEATHAQTADNLALTQAHQLAVNEAVHAQAADNLTLTQVHVLTIAEATHAQAADNLALTQAHQLAANEATHGHSAENVTLNTSDLLVIADALHSHAADGLTLTQDHLLAIDAALHAHSAEQIALTQDHILIISDALHAHLADVVGLTVPAETPTPDDRVFIIRAENRTYIVAAETRTFTINTENRTYTVH